MVFLRTLVLFVVGLLAVLFAQPAYAATTATVPVTNTLDSGPGSLRQAVLDAVLNDTVIFSQDVFSVTQAIGLGDQIEITKSLTIDGAYGGASAPVITSNQHRILSVTTGVTVTLMDLQLSSVCYLTCADSGGGIYNGGILSATRIYVNGITSRNRCAAFDNYGSLTLSDSMISGNVAYGYGAGGCSSGRLTIVRSTVTNNDGTDPTGHGSSGGITSSGEMIVINSTFSSNRASAINNGGTLDIRDSFFTGNSAEFDGMGGAIVTNGTTNILHTIFTGNSISGADYGCGCGGGGAIFNIGTLTAVISRTFGC